MKSNFTKSTRLTVGLYDQDTKQQEISTLDAYKVVNNIVLRFTTGATIMEGRGIYTHDDGSVVVEPSLQVQLLNLDVDVVETIIDELKSALNQESIMQEDTEVQISFK